MTNANAKINHAPYCPSNNVIRSGCNCCPGQKRGDDWYVRNPTLIWDHAKTRALEVGRGGDRVRVSTDHEIVDGVLIRSPVQA